MATMKTLNGYGFNATELNGKTSDNYLLITDTASDSAKLGGKAPEYYIQPRNLLDNSDFRNPVNQRGIYSAVSGSYIIDRWYFINSNSTGNITITESANGITITNDAGVSIAMVQRFIDKSYYDGKYTVVIKTTDSLKFGYVEVVSSENGLVQATNWIPSGTTVVWAALYEGSYTADTLPPYVPKGYAAELAECLRYFERLGSTFSEQIGNIVYVVSGAKSFVCSLQCSRKRIPNPSVSFSGVDNYRLLLKDATNASVYNADSISSFDSITVQEPFISFRTNMVNAITQNSWIQLQRADGATAAYIDVSADL